MTNYRLIHPHKAILVSLILVLGFALRAVDIDATGFGGDEAWIAFLAYSWGHNGQRQEIGTFSSTSLPLSPFHNDLFAIPFSFSPDVRLARLFMAGLHLVSMAALYLFVRRNWSERTALVALVLYAFMARPAWAARSLWHPNLALPFMIGYLATGFLAAEGKPWARRLHPIMLCFAFQSHPATAIAAPLMLGFVGRDWWCAQVAKRGRLVLDYVAGIVVAGLLLVPWMVGIIHFRADHPSTAGVARLSETSAPSLILSFLIDIPTRLLYDVVPNSGYSEPPDALVMLFRGIGWFTLFASLFLVGRAVLQRRRYMDLMIGLAYLLVPVLLLVLPERTYNHYLMPVLPAVAVVQAIVLVGYGQRNVQWLRVPALVIVIVCLAQASVVVSTVRQYYSFTKFTRNDVPSLAEMTRFRDGAVRPGYETIYLLEGFTDTEFTQSMMWQVLADNKGPSRVIWGDSLALPVPVAGATYVGFTDAVHIPELYANREARLSIGNVYKAVDLPPNSAFTPTCQPDGPNRLGNGATILGYFTPSERSPRPGQPWTIYLLWQGQPSTLHQNFQLFNHLVDDKGDRYAQRDMSSLPTDLWRDGEQLVSKVTLTATDKLPVDSPLSVRVGMYTLPDVINSPVVDQAGNPVAGWVTIPVC